jgi:hypothetical protein
MTCCAFKWTWASNTIRAADVFIPSVIQFCLPTSYFRM